ncbi:MAG: beta-glucosidase BglX [Bacteroidetes bacterium]|nr:beta-glucosidase BglX [Bacteroidota bacterium]
MKKLFVAGALLLLAYPSFSQSTYTAKARALMAKMTLEEKIGQLNLIIPGGAAVTGSVVSTDVENKIKKGMVGGLFGITSPEKVRKAQELAVNGSRLHIPMIFGLDVIHGHKTIFPIPLGLSTSWDMALIEQSARIAAKEATADGLNWAFSPMVDIARDARWGRISEGSGEDPYLGGKIAQAMVRGYQGTDLSKNNTLMACVKHFALYGASEAGREYNTVDMSRIQMYEYYLPPYKAAIDAGAGSIMSSFNLVDGVPATGNKWLLTDLLRKEWGFNGFVVSDYTSLNEMINHGMGDLQTVSALALKAGLDMDMVGEGMLTTLAKSLKEGKVTVADIDKACLRILEAKYKLGLFDDPYRYIDESRPAKEILTADNRAAARNIAAHSMVLLKNDKQVLPLKRSGTIALVGPLADNRRNMLGTWVVAGDWNKSVSVLEGFKNVAGSGVNIISAKGANITDDTAMFLKRVNALGVEAVIDPRSPQEMIDEAVAAANKSDVVVAVVGESANMSGESSSRADISLPASQQALLKALHKTGKPLVVVLINGRPLTLVWENEHATAILEAWAPGTEAGNAVADVLFGNYNPSGKLSATFPRSVGQIPIYYNHKNTGRPYDGTGGAKFKTSYLDEVNEPLYPFGYGLSYTQFDYSPVKLSKTVLKGEEKLTASVTLTNSGKYAGEEVVQLYISDPVASVSRSVKDLKGFQKVMLQPGESKEISFTVTTDELKFFNSELKKVWEPGKFVIHIGTSSSDVKSAEVEWNK